MRDQGDRFELLPLRPNDHIGWAFAGSEEFARLATDYLQEGATRRERLMYVARDPKPEDLGGLSALVDRGALEITSVAEVYGASGLVDAAVQRAVFSEALAKALDDGYEGIRVAADNTALVSDAQRLESWIRWEIVADRFMAGNAVTGLCAFDTTLVDVDVLRHLATLHPLSSASCPRPQFRMFSDGEKLFMEGEIDSFAIDQAVLALNVLPPKTELVLDRARATFLGGAEQSALRRLSAAGVRFSLIG